jgi:NAD(P)-dependent dehydrogenase (short-subunit alcohol dehydrogenase family)
MDVSSQPSVDPAIATIIGEQGRLDVIVHDAARTSDSALVSELPILGDILTGPQATSTVPRRFWFFNGRIRIRESVLASATMRAHVS